MDYEKKYKEALERAKEIIQDYKKRNLVGILFYAKEDLEGIFPELAESEDEKIRKAIIDFVNEYGDKFFLTLAKGNAIAWLEKQKDINSKEYVFRPLAGCDINTASIQAVEQQKLGKKIVLAFNGAYIPVEEKTTDDIVNEYYSWLEKRKYTQRDVDDAYLKGVADTKNILKNQGKQTTFFQNVSLTEFEEALADVCRGWIGEEIGWKDYIVRNANALLKICQKMWNEIRDDPFEQKPTWSEEDEKAFADVIGFLNLYGQFGSSKFVSSLKDRLKGE